MNIIQKKVLDKTRSLAYNASDFTLPLLIRFKCYGV